MFLCVLKANEVGDFLAGVFAPLAFVWLAAAVLIQTQELTAQRKSLDATREELKLTRGEHEMSRGVLSQQSAYMGKQTEIMEHTFDRERQMFHDQFTNERYATAKKAIVHYLSGKYYQFEGEDPVAFLPDGELNFRDLANVMELLSNKLTPESKILTFPILDFQKAKWASIQVTGGMEYASENVTSKLDHEGFMEYYEKLVRLDDPNAEMMMHPAVETK